MKGIKKKMKGNEEEKACMNFEQYLDNKYFIISYWINSSH